MKLGIRPEKGEVEVWKDIPNYEGLYQVSSFGRFKSYPKAFNLHHGGVCNTQPRILKFTLRMGYHLIILTKNLIRTTFSTHRIVAEVFVENKFSKPHVNHKDGDRLNNYYKNLEWTTPSENVQHSYDVLKRKPSVTGRIFNRTQATQRKITGELIKTFDSIAKAAISTGIKRHHIGDCINKKRKTAGGFLWT